MSFFIKFFACLVLCQAINYLYSRSGTVTINDSLVFGTVGTSQNALIFNSILLVIFCRFVLIKKQIPTGLAFAVGGAASNLLDRLFYRGTVDYIALSVWPVFNIADVFIVAGLFFAVLSQVRSLKAN